MGESYFAKCEWRIFYTQCSNYTQEARFTKDVSPLIQIRWTSVDVLIQILITNLYKAH